MASIVVAFTWAVSVGCPAENSDGSCKPSAGVVSMVTGCDQTQRSFEPAWTVTLTIVAATLGLRDRNWKPDDR